jgi:serine/threonine protein kinase
LDVAEGLEYLHANHTSHGDLKGVGSHSALLQAALVILDQSNILVDSSGHARLTDFGFASVVLELGSVLGTNAPEYTSRWAAPEVLRSGDVGNTQEADVFAFGMVVVEVSPCISSVGCEEIADGVTLSKVFTGKSPFSEFTATVAASKIKDGERPDRPQDPDLTDSVWDMTRTCWCHDPAHRPTISKVVEILRE